MRERLQKEGALPSELFFGAFMSVLRRRQREISGGKGSGMKSETGVVVMYPHAKKVQQLLEPKEQCIDSPLESLQGPKPYTRKLICLGLS